MDKITSRCVWLLQLPAKMLDSDVNLQEQSSKVSGDAVDVEISDTDDFFESSELENEEEIKENIEQEEAIALASKIEQVKEKCPKCPKLFHKSHLKRHMKAAHVYKRTFSCTLYNFGKGFTTKKKLEHHVTYDHEENITVPEDKMCPYCKVTITL